MGNNQFFRVDRNYLVGSGAPSDTSLAAAETINRRPGVAMAIRGAFDSEASRRILVLPAAFWGGAVAAGARSGTEIDAFGRAGGTFVDRRMLMGARRPSDALVEEGNLDKILAAARWGLVPDREALAHASTAEARRGIESALTAQDEALPGSIFHFRASEGLSAFGKPAV